MVNVAPLAPTLTSPPNNGHVIVSDPVVFAWNFHDPGDVQNDAVLRYKVPAGAWVTSAYTPAPDNTFTLPGGTLTAGILYEWQVFTRDSINQPSPWSASWFVTAIEAVPAPTITAPAVAATVAATPLLVEWDLPVGFTQDAYRAQVTDSTGTVYDSGVVESVAARTVLAVLPAGSGDRDVVVAFRYGGHWSVAAVAPVTLELPAPGVPMVVLAQVPTGLPEVTVTVVNPVPEGGPPRANLTKNPGFEVDTIGWSINGGAMPVRDTAQARSGAASERYDTTAAGQSINFLATGSVPGLPYTASVYVRGTGSARLDLNSYSDAGPGVFASGAVTTLTGAWQRVSVTGVRPADSFMMNCRVTQASAGANSMWVDDAFSEQSASLGDYFDGDTPNGAFFYAWTGTPHDSVSVATAALTDTVSVDILRDGVRIATGLPPNATYVDRLPGAGPVDYIARAFAANGSSAESY